MKEEELLYKRFRELAQKCYQKNQYTYTGFLSMADIACFYEMQKELSFVSHSIWGGTKLAERAILRFGSEEQLGYAEEFPIVCLQARPLSAKFADNLTHRDFLGAIMNLGIERSTIGDIFLIDNIGYFFCLEKVAAYLMENISTIKHTSVSCKEIKEIPQLQVSEKSEKVIQISSERIDGVIAKTYQLSRGEALELFAQKKVFINGRLCTNNSRLLKDNEAVSVRGYGRFEYLNCSGVSKKGKMNAHILIYTSPTK